MPRVAANSERPNNHRQHHKGGDWVAEVVAAEGVAEVVVVD